jgi:16S rRNA (cytidine1402-2'-O)-methyltransferase
MATGLLYIVATPIGNLNDMTLRAIDVLADVDIILSEDTRIARRLLDFIYSLDSRKNNRKPRLLSYHQHSSERRKLEILNYIMNGFDIALVTDAGTPGISDPGNELVDYILTRNPDLKVIPIPGPSAVTAALSICGFNAANFTFIGFMPKKGFGSLVKALELGFLVVFFDSPYRIIDSMTRLSMLPHPPKRVFVAQELTKLHERVIRGDVEEVKMKLELQEKELGRVKGEIVVVLAP